MAKIIFFIRRRWLMAVAIFILLSVVVYKQVGRKDVLYKTEADIIFIGKEGTFNLQSEIEKIKSEDFLKKLSEKIPSLDPAAFKKEIEILIKKKDLVSVSLVSDKPQFARDVVNKACSLFLNERYDELKELKNTKKTALDELSKEIEQWQRKLDLAEKNLRDLKDRNIDLDTKRSELSKRLDELTLQKAENLKVFTEQHPDVIELSGKIETLQSEIKNLPDNSAAYNKLASEIEEKKSDLLKKQKEYQQLYDSYKGEAEPWHAELEKEASLPTQPMGMYKEWYYMWGLSTAFLISILTAIILELLDKKIYTKQEAERRLRIPVVSEIKRVAFIDIRKGKTVRPSKSILLDKTVNALKKFEQLYTFLKVETFKGNIDKKIILITSAEARTGKTFIAYNLALAAARNGERALLVDANLRYPGVDSIFKAGYDKKGLSDIVKGSVKYKDAVKNITDLLLGSNLKFTEQDLKRFDNLKIILSGNKVENPLSVLDTKALSNLFKELADTYGFIIIDSAATKDFPDTVNIIPSADAVLLVAKRAKTTYPLINNAIAQVKKINISITGLVLSNV